MTEVKLSAKSELVVVSEVYRIDRDGNKVERTHPMGVTKRSLAIFTRDKSGIERLGRISFDEDISQKMIDEPTFQHPAGGNGIDANLFLQAVLDHAWSEGFRPAALYEEREREITGIMSRHAEEMADQRKVSYDRGYRNGLANGRDPSFTDDLDDQY